MSEDAFKLIFSNNLKYYMSLKGKTQIDIVNDLGFDKSAVSTWCNGTRLPRMDKVNALANYLGVKRSDLIEERSAAEITSLNPDDLILLQAYHNADPDIQFSVRTILGIKKESSTLSKAE